jgi:hypothetical protein
MILREESLTDVSVDITSPENKKDQQGRQDNENILKNLVNHVETYDQGAPVSSPDKSTCSSVFCRRCCQAGSSVIMK